MKGSILIIKGDNMHTLSLAVPPDIATMRGIVGGEIERIPGFNTVAFNDRHIRQCAAFCHEQGRRESLPRNTIATRLWEIALRRSGNTGALQDHLAGNVAIITGTNLFMNAFGLS